MLADRFYQVLLHLVPKGFRDEFGDEMEQDFADALRDVAPLGPLAVARLCTRECLGLIVNSISERRRPVTRFIYGCGLVLSTLATGLVAMGFFGIDHRAPLLLALWFLGAPLLILSLLWAAQNLDVRLWMGAGLIGLAVLWLPDQMVNVTLWGAGAGAPDGPPAQTGLLTIPAILVIAATLIYRGEKAWHPAETPTAGSNSRLQYQSGHRVGGLALVLAAVLILSALQEYYWFMVWDATFDPLGVLWLILPSLVILIAGVSMLGALKGNGRWAALVFLLLVPILYAVLHTAENVDFRQLTVEHAAQTSRAIESYYAREGRYPLVLDQLVPRDLIALPEPVILYGQEWCYDSGSDFYRLGYVDREHWSNPNRTGRLYKSLGEIPNLPPICSREIAGLQKLDPRINVVR